MSYPKTTEEIERYKSRQRHKAGQHRLQRTPKERGQAATPPLARRRDLAEMAR
jgi:hypothetical protein